jgi:ComF family protein
MFRYRLVIRRAIAAMKYRFVSDMAKEVVAGIPPTSYNVVEQMISFHQSITLLPIPLHPSRFRFRGFNQAQILGVHLANHLGIPMETGILRRVKVTETQVSVVNRHARIANMNHAFTISPHVDIHGRAFILVDDVFTTGATARSACDALKKAGADFVWIMTLAR